LYSLSAINVKH